MSALLVELQAAYAIAQRPELSEALAACGLRPGGPVWGVDFVAFDSHHYAPAPGGKAAVIAPVFASDGDIMEIVDLVACGLETRAMRTRSGVATVLGGQWVDMARETGGPLRLFPDAVEWLRNRGRGAVILDQRAARFALADVPAVNWCGDEKHARQLRHAMERPATIPQFFIREAAIHAPA
jgi:hypothetical protein